MITIQRLTGHAKMSETETELDICLFLTFPWAKVRNRKTRQYVTAETLTTQPRRRLLRKDTAARQELHKR